MKLENTREAKISDRQKVNAWLDWIGEHDQAVRDEVLENCAKDKEARSYYVKRYEQRGEHDRA